jgi:hypothetical protein
MSRRVFILWVMVLLASGCTGAAEERSPRTGETLRTFIKLSKDERPRLGKPILLTLGLVNDGVIEVSVDYGKVYFNNPFVVTGPDGKPVPYIGGHTYCDDAPTLQLEPGGEMIFIRDLELRDQYLIDKPGRYVVGYGMKDWVIDGKLAKVKPCTLEIDVAAGKLDRREEIAARLFPLVPKDWSLAISSRRTDDEDSGQIEADVWRYGPLPKEATVVFAVGFVFQIDGRKGTDPAEEFLGKTRWGFLFAYVNKRTEEFWPHWRKAVVEALGVTPP